MLNGVSTHLPLDRLYPLVVSHGAAGSHHPEASLAAGPTYIALGAHRDLQDIGRISQGPPCIGKCADQVLLC
jgi:hypothetical protein